jgi:hypothetical protein
MIYFSIVKLLLVNALLTVSEFFVDRFSV